MSVTDKHTPLVILRQRSSRLRRELPTKDLCNLPAARMPPGTASEIAEALFGWYLMSLAPLGAQVLPLGMQRTNARSIS